MGKLQYAHGLAALAVRVGLCCALWSSLAVGAESEPAKVHLSERAELDRAIELYHSGQYETCKVDLERLLSSPDVAQRPEDRGLRERAHLYLATCSLMLGDETRSRQALREALEANPLMASPDSLSFPPPLVALFLQVRDDVQSLIANREAEEVERSRAAGRKAQAEERERAARERALRELAAQETLVTANSRVVAFLPFGAGQYQNGNHPLGNFFLVSETGVGVVAGVSGLILLDLYRQALQVDPAADDNSKFQAAYTAFAVSSWTFVGLVVLGALEANLSYKDMRVLGVRKRGLSLTDPSSTSQSNELRWTGSRAKAFEIYPYGGALPSGAFFGLSGKF